MKPEGFLNEIKNQKLSLATSSATASARPASPLGTRLGCRRPRFPAAFVGEQRLDHDRLDAGIMQPRGERAAEVVQTPWRHADPGGGIDATRAQAPRPQ